MPDLMPSIVDAMSWVRANGTGPMNERQRHPREPPNIQKVATCKVMAEEDLVGALKESGLAGALSDSIPDSDVHPFARIAYESANKVPPNHDVPDHVYVYTDGSYTHEGNEEAEPAFAVVVLYCYGEEYHYRGALHHKVEETLDVPMGDIDNNVCEAAAMVWALAWIIAADVSCDVTIESDSTLAMGAARSVMRANHVLAEQAAAMLTLARQFGRVDLTHVRARQGHPWNEIPMI